MPRQRNSPITPQLRGRRRQKGSRKGQGVILTWDPVTFENTVSFRGQTYTNMPLLTVTDAVNYTAGDIVVIDGWAPEGKLSSWCIIGRIVIPPKPIPET